MALTQPSAGSGATPANSSEIKCQADCPPDFQIVAENGTIIKADGGSIPLSAEENPLFPVGEYSWNTDSAKIRIVNPNSPSIRVEALGTPSSGRDAEIIKVTRRSAGCPNIEKNIKVTVARVKFSAAATQRYGYDDYDTPANQSDDHVSIKTSDYTFVKVVIQGGALGTDFDFICDNAGFCTSVAPGGTDSFDLRLDAGASAANPKQETTLHAKVKSPDAVSFANIKVNIYAEKVVDVVVGKFYDSTVAATNLRFPNQNYAAFKNDINDKLKEAVIKFNITNFDANPTDVHYDLDGNGALTYDIKAGGGAELTAIQNAFTGTDTKKRVAVIRNMKSYYYLSANAAKDDTTVKVTAGKVFDYPAGFQVALGTSANQEMVTVKSVSGNEITLDAKLGKPHAAGEPLEFPAAGWSCDPILIIEGNASINVLKWTIPHEVGHNPIGFKDVDDTTNCMHYSQGGTDYRLRYCPRTKHYEAGTENQWEKVSR